MMAVEPVVRAPRPDYGAAAVAVGVAVLVLATGGGPGAALFAAVIAGLFSAPLFLIAREITMFSTRRPLEPGEAEVVADWLRSAGAAVGARSVTVLYAYRKGAGIQLVQLGGATGQGEAEQGGLLGLIHRSAWTGLPSAARTPSGGLLVAVPARIMDTMYRMAGRGREGSYLSLTSRSHVRLVYGTLREMADALNRGAGRLYAAYIATKAFTRLLVKGRIRLSPELAARVDSLVPVEPWWIRRRIRRQLMEEAALAVQP